MRLLSLRSDNGISCDEFGRNNVPPYAILSHTWGTEEFTFADLQDEQARKKIGYRKVRFCGEQAERDGLRYFWVDSCCIDKENSTELTEAINSMFRWYRGAVKCYVHLSDVSASAVGSSAEHCQSAWEADFRKSRWFRRGWTLQELLAPADVAFYSLQHQQLGTKASLCSLIHDITGIPKLALRGQPLDTFAPEERWKWVAGRETTVEEDEAYCLLGIFDIYMPLIYGERKDSAMRRLRKELGMSSNKGKAYNPEMGDHKRDLDACLRSLGFASLDAREKDIVVAHRDTCDWIFHTEEFRKWRKRRDISENFGVLWIKGKPGAGKSTLMKHILRYCERKFKDHLVVSYFFNARGEQLEKTPLGMLRSIVYQLVQGDQSICEKFLDRFRDKQTRSETAKVEWRAPDLHDFILSVTNQKSGQPLLLIVDALDECIDDDSRRYVVRFLEQMSDQAVRTGADLRICLSSRHYPEITMKKKIELNVDKIHAHHEDITKYVVDTLDMDDDSVREIVREKSNGVFLWAVLVVAILNKLCETGQVEQALETLDDLPGDLEEVFDRILTQGELHEETVLMLQFVLFSPDPLRPAELYFGVVTKTTPKLRGTWDRDKIKKSVIRRRITHASRGLIEISKETGWAQFIHKSVDDFLRRNRKLERLDPTLAPDAQCASYRRLWSCSWSYMELVFDARARKQDPRRLHQWNWLDYALEQEEQFPFLTYALEHVFFFANKAQLTLGNDEIAAWMQAHGEWNKAWQELSAIHPHEERAAGDGIIENQNLLTVLAQAGYEHLVRFLLAGQEVDVNAHQGSFYNPIQAASVEGRQNVVQMLLDAGADVDSRGTSSLTALILACERRSTFRTLHRERADLDLQAIVQMLLNAGADVSAQGGTTGDALQVASSNGWQPVVQMLLDAGADVNAQGGKYGHALQAASSGGWQPVVQMLLAAGANVNAQGGKYGNALQAASAKGLRATVQMLLDAGANVNAQGREYGNALQAASIQGSRSTVRLLLDAGAKVNARGGYHGTALQAACRRPSKQVVRILLSAGADATIRGGYDGSALKAAMRHDRQPAGKEIIRMLLEAGADREGHVTESE